MPTPILTACRQAVWTAIDTFAPLQNTFKKKYRFEDKPGRVPGGPSPTIGELPAISIYPAGAKSVWAVNSAQRIDYPLLVTIWTPDWQVLDAERLWQVLIQAVHQNLGTVTNGFRVKDQTIITPSLDQDGPTMTEWNFQLLMDAGFWDPRKVEA